MPLLIMILNTLLLLLFFNYYYSGKLSQNGKSSQKGKVHLSPNVSSSAHDCGCVVNGGGAMAAI